MGDLTAGRSPNRTILGPSVVFVKYWFDGSSLEEVYAVTNGVVDGVGIQPAWSERSFCCCGSGCFGADFFCEKLTVRASERANQDRHAWWAICPPWPLQTFSGIPVQLPHLYFANVVVGF